MTWHGWLWRRGKWKRVCSAEGIGACSRLLGSIARQRGIKDAHTALTAGSPPAFNPPVPRGGGPGSCQAPAIAPAGSETTSGPLGSSDAAQNDWRDLRDLLGE